MTYMGSASRQAEVRLYKANVNFYTQGGTSKIDLDVGNSGTADTAILKVYCGPAIGNTTEQTPAQALPLTLAQGQVVKITINYDWTAGAIYYFKVISSAGQTLGPWYEQAPT